MKIHIGFVVAMQDEADILASFLGLTLQKEEKNSYLTYANAERSIIMITPGIDAAFTRKDNSPVSRVGKVSAAVVTTILIEKYHPDRIINCGTAGGIAGTDAKKGDIIVADYVANHDIRLPFPEYNKYGVRKIPLNIPDTFTAITLPFKIGTISSGESFIYTKEEWDMILRNDAVAKEMEAAGVMQAVQILNYKNPVYVIKTITDTIPSSTHEEDFVKNFDGAMNKLGEFIKEVVKLYE